MLALRSAETGRIDSTTLSLFGTEAGALVVAVAEALMLRWVVRLTDVADIMIKFEYLNQEVNCVTLVEVLLYANSDIDIS